MAAGIPARLTPAEGRKFAFTVGLAFLALAGVSRWRGHETPPLVLAAVGGALLVAGVVVPGRLGPVYRGWMRLALAISKVTTPIFMGVVYFLVFTPIGLVMRLVGHRPLRAAAPGASVWVRRTAPAGDLRRQF